MRTHLVAQGAWDGGTEPYTWILTVHEQDDGANLTMLYGRDASGRVVCRGGGTGPPVHPGRQLSVNSGGDVQGPRFVHVLAQTYVRRVVLTNKDGTEQDLEIFDHDEFPDTRFGVILVPRTQVLASVAALGGYGRELERFSLAYHERIWREGPAKSG
jgi:hypothetical protein